MSIYFSEKPYFASESSCSEDFTAAKSAGLVLEGEEYFQLQRNDALGHFHGDVEAIAAAVSDAARGDQYARSQLALASTDLLVLEIGASCVL